VVHALPVRCPAHDSDTHRELRAAAVTESFLSRSEEISVRGRSETTERGRSRRCGWTPQPHPSAVARAVVAVAPEGEHWHAIFTARAVEQPSQRLFVQYYAG
jgi:hypothetical protein